MDIMDLQGYYFEYITKIPKFIDAKNQMDKILWDIMFGISELLSILICDKILTDKQIMKISKEFSEQLELILGLNHQIEVWTYYDIILRDLVNICEGSELFEAAHNINTFYKNNFIE